MRGLFCWQVSGSLGFPPLRGMTRKDRARGFLASDEEHRRICNSLTYFARLQGEPCSQDHQRCPERVGGEQVGYLDP